MCPSFMYRRPQVLGSFQSCLDVVCLMLRLGMKLEKVVFRFFKENKLYITVLCILEMYIITQAFS